jgi:hypothetical protein
MTTGNNKYDRLIDSLRKSKPVFNNAEDLSERVIRHIREEKSAVTLRELVIEFFFGWVYIGWVRKSMVTAAIVILIFFGYQQTLILQRINGLPPQNSAYDQAPGAISGDKATNSMVLFRMNGKKLSEKEITISEKEIDELIKSVNKIQLKYGDLFTLIEKDPVLKKYVESKMIQSRKN